MQENVQGQIGVHEPPSEETFASNREAMKISFQLAFRNKVSSYSSLSKMTMKERMLPIPKSRARHLNSK